MDHAIIDNYRDLPIGVYLDILSIQETEPDEFRRQALTIGALAALNEQEVLALPIDEYKRLRASSAFLSQPCPEDLLRISHTYPVGPWTLRPVLDYGKLTVAQYVDFQTFSKDRDHNLPQILSVVLIPDGHTYNDGYDMAVLQEAIREEMGVADALALAAHFFASSSALTASSLDYCRALAARMENSPQKTEMLERITEAERLLRRSGDGSLLWTPSRSSATAPGSTSGR